MADPQKRTYSSVYNALKQISDEEGIDFGLDGQTEEQFKQKYFTGPGNINNLYNKLSQISDEEGVDFGLGTRGEWLGSFGFTEEDAKPRKGYKPTADDLAGFQKTISGAQRTVGSSLPSFDAKTQNLQKRQGLNVPSRVEVGKSNNLVKGNQTLNPETGQLEDTYVTSQGNEYNSEFLADQEQQAIDRQDRDRRYMESLPGELDDAYAERDRISEEMKKYSAPSSGYMPMQNTGGWGMPAAFNQNNPKYLELEAALHKVNERITTLEAERDDDGGTQFWRGVWDVVSNPVNFSTGGVARDAVALYGLSKKINSGEPLNKEAQMLGEATVNADRAEQNFGKNRGTMYEFGSIFGHSVPFMLDIASTGGMGGLTSLGVKGGTKLGGKLAEKYVSSALGKAIMKNLGKRADKIAQGIIKGTTYAGGLEASGLLMANTVGAGNTASDILQRNLGHLRKGPDGLFYFEGGEDFGTAFLKGQASQSFEYASEMLGEKLDVLPKFINGAIARTLEKHGASQTLDFLRRIGNNKFVKAGKQFLNFAGVQSTFGEGMEEEANMVLNAIFTGDNTWFKTDPNKDAVFDLNTQLKLWGSMALTSAVLRTPYYIAGGRQAAGYYGYKYANDAADVKASSVFGADNWQMIKEEIDNCDNDYLPTLLESVIKGDMTQEQKEATMYYADSLLKMRGYNLATMSNTEEQAKEGEQDIVSQDLDQNYQVGHETQEPDLLKWYKEEAQQAAEDLPKYGEEFAKMVTTSQDPVATMTDLMNKRDIYTDEQIAAAADYFQKMYRVNGAMDGAISRVDLEVEGMKATTRANTHQQTGNVVMAKGADDMDYYVIGGDIVTDESGLTSLAGTGGAVVVKDAVTGEITVKSPQDVMVYNMQPAEELLNYYDTEYRQQLMQQADDDFTYGSPANEVYQLEDTVTLQDGEGNTIEGEIGMMPNAVDGVYVVYTSDRKAMQLTADELNRRIVAHNGQEVQRASAQAPVAETQQGSNIGSENIPAQGNNAGENIPNQPQPAQSGVETGGEAGAESGTGANEQPASALSKIPVLTDEKGKPVLNKKGKPQYQWHKASVEDAAAALIETTGGDMVMARDTASDLVKNAQAGLEKIRKQKPKGDDPIEIAESRMEIKRQEQEQQAIIKQWQDVNQAIQKQMRDEAAARQAEAEAAKTEEQRRKEAEEARMRKEKQDEQDRQRLREAIERDREKRNREYQPLVDARKEMAGDDEALSVLNDTEPRDLQEWVSSMIRPHSMLWQDTSDSERGLQSELGLKRGDMQRMMTLLGTKENGAKPFGQVVLDIYEGLPEAMKEQYSDEDVRNTLLDLFNEGSSTRMMHLTEENRIAEAREMLQENLRREAEAELEAWADFYRLTPEERDTFEEFMSMPPSEVEAEVINQIIAEYEESNRAGETVDSQPASGTADRESEGGESQVQGQAAETAGADQEQQGPEQGAEASAGSQNVPDSDVPGGEPTIAPAEQLKPTDLRDNIKPDSAMIGESKAERWALSEKRARNGERFYQTNEGDINLVDIPQDVFDKINYTKAPFRLTESMAEHVYKQHAKELKFESVDDAIDFVIDVMTNFDHVRLGDNGSLIFSIENGRNTTGKRAITILLSSDSGDYYGIKTSGYETLSRLKKRPLLWDGSAETPSTDTATEPVTSRDAQQGGEQSGSASGQSGLSEGKDTNNSSNLQDNSGKSSDLGATSSPEQIAEEESKVDTNPSEAQKEAGNYKKGHINVDGYDITIENPKGSIRRGTDASGKPWETEMHNTYGYIRGTEGVDGDHIDVFLSDNPTSGSVFVVDQVNPATNEFDEHKVMYGFGSEEEAREAYLANYSKGWKGLGNITEVSREDFKKWIESSHRKTKPFAEYKLAKEADLKRKLNNGLKEEEFVDINLPLQERPLKSSTRFNGEHVVGLEEYEERLKDHRANIVANTDAGMESGDSAGSAADMGTGEEVSGQVGEGGDNKVRGEKEDRQPDGSGLGLSLEETDRELEAVRQEKQRRQDEWAAFSKKYNVASDGRISPEDYLRAFNDLNSDEENKRLMDLVLKALNGNLGLLNILKGLNYKGEWKPFSDTVNISEDWITRGVDNQNKANTMLHELLHKVTADMMDLYRVPGLRNRMDPETREAINTLYAIHNAMKEAFPHEYGSKHVRELVAEMANPSLREALRSIYYDRNANVTWWDKLVNAIRSIFGLGSKADYSTDALKDASAALDRLLNSDFRSARQAYLPIRILKAPFERLLQEEKTMMGVHNISEDKLRKAIKLGGLANPSMAVIDTDQHMHTDYGEISLIPKASLIDARTGRNAGTFTADAWTPSFPPVDLVMKESGWNKVYKDLKNIRESADGGNEISPKLRVYLESYLDNRDPDAMYWWYMHDRGLDPKTLRNESAYDKKIQKRVMEMTGGDIYKGISDLSEKDAKEIVDLYHEYKKSKGEEVTSAESRIQKIRERLKDPDLKPMVRLNRERWLKDLEKYGEPASSVDQFMQSVVGDAQREGQVDLYTTFMNARKAVESEGRKADYGKWLDEFNKRYGVEEKIFTGYTTSGNRKYVPNTLENVSRLMRKEGLNGAVNWSSIGNWIAKVANKEKTLEGIRRNRKNLETTKEQHDAFREDWGNLLYPISLRLGNGDMYNGENIMSDILEHKDYAGYYKREYGKELTQDEKDTIDEFIKQVRTKFPTGYFETKFERPVYLNEFEVAVVPENTSPEVVKTLKDAGLDVRTYDTSDYDTKEEKRRQATMEAVRDRSDILFQKKDRNDANAPSEQDKALRDELIDEMRNAGIDVITDTVEGQRVLDEASGKATLSKSKKRAVETASLNPKEGSPADISTADGAKIQKNLESYANKLEKVSNLRKNFLDELAAELGATSDGSKSKYATFITKNGDKVTIRLGNHNATVSNFDYRGEDNGISIVVSRRENEGINNDGNAHIVEAFYPEIALRKAYGKPLAEIVRSINEALESGKYNDTTGLAEIEEVNADEIKQQKVYHGSGAKFDAFDHSHMGEGAGSQSFGYGTYVTSSPDIGKNYAKISSRGWNYKGDYRSDLIEQSRNKSLPEGRYNSDEQIVAQVLDYLDNGYSFDEAVNKVRNFTESAIKDHEENINELSPAELKDLEGYRQEKALLDSLKPEDFKKDDRFLYDVEIKDDNEAYYIDYQGKMGDQKDILDMVDNALTADGWKRQEIDSRTKFIKGKKQIILTPNQSGADLYAELEDALGSDKAASEFLYEAGITGIKYPAGTIMGGGNGATNYVIFNEADAKVTGTTKFFRTPDGQAYGFTYKGKVYVDPRIATSETPIHEYTHLWAEMKRQTAPDEWKRIKDVLLNDETVKPFIDKVRQQYPELTGEGREDDFLEEVLTQYSGKTGSEKLREVADEIARENGAVFGKAQAVVALQKMRNLLKRFWKGVCDMMGWKYTRAEDIADKVLSDLLNGVNPTVNVSAASETPVFVSNALKAVEGIQQNKATPEQWLKMIEKQGGLKAGEDKWLGLSDWLKSHDKKSLSKQEVEDYIRQNQIQIEETPYQEFVDIDNSPKMQEFRKEFDEIVSELNNEKEANQKDIDAFDEEMFEKYGYGWHDKLNDEERKRDVALVAKYEELEDINDLAFRDMVNRYGDDFGMAFEVNYGNGKLEPQTDMYGDGMSDAARYFLELDERPIDSTRLEFTTQGLDNKREIALTVPAIEPYNEGDQVHFGDAGEGRSVAWVRFGDTTDADGNKVLVIDEIQSKRHQDARDKGYKQYSLTDASEAQTAFNDERVRLCEKYDIPKNPAKQSIGLIGDAATESEKSHLQDLYDKWQEVVDNAYGDGVPSAPFEKNWHELAMKRMLRYAAENGYDKIAWTTGEQQAERYNIGNVVNKVISYDYPEVYDPDGRKSKKVEVRLKNGDTMTMRVDQNGKVIEGRSETQGKQLSDVVGKDLAKSIMNGEGKDGSIYDANRDLPAKIIEGDGLRIGGDGMKGFYDQILPRFMDKYGKKWGVKVGEVDLPGLEESARKMWAVDVTPEMREGVLQGQPMFQRVPDDTEDVEVPDFTDADIAQTIYDQTLAKGSTKWQEAWQDSMVSLKAIQDAIAKETGNTATGAENAYKFENRMHGRAKNMSEQFDWQYYQPLLKAFDQFTKDKRMSIDQAMDYMIAKHGLERNMYYSFRDAMKEKVMEQVRDEREKLEKKYAQNRISEVDYNRELARLKEQETTGVDEAISNLRESDEYRQIRQDYEGGLISYPEYIRRGEALRRSLSQRKTPKKDEDGNIVSTNYYDDHAQDFSGLTGTLAKDMYDDAQKVKRQAQRTVDPETRKRLWKAYDKRMREAYQTARGIAEDMVMSAEEQNTPVNGTAAGRLWDAVNAATKRTLQMSYEGGMMDRRTYEKVRNMFDYYIPLRGWAEDKASDVYSYIGKENVFSPAVKKTWGRTSEAENPLAYIGNIAVSTILAGHRNLMKQHFLNYVMNNPTSLVSVSESWYENIGNEGDNPVWVLRTADTAGKSPDEVIQIVNDFNEEMRLKQAEGKAIPVTGRLRLDVNATKGQKAEHVVEVQRAGHNYQLYINGDPRAAQALNGTIDKAVSRISDTWMGKHLTNLNRSMAAFFTSKNPAFIVSNLSRDLNMAGASVAVKEGAAYNAQFIKNVTKVLTPRLGESAEWIPSKKQPTGLMPSLMRKYKKGTLNVNNETERYFKEFMDEGAETGFVNMLSVDSFKEKMQKEIKQMQGSSLLGGKVKETSVGKALRLLGETFEFYNRCAEDATRFIVYMTSRQMGKPLEDAIADAKDVTLNFNRKGTGDKGNAEIRDLFIFVNPAIQALANMYWMAKKKPLKFGSVALGFIAGGALVPIINQWLMNLMGDDDDKDSYWNLPPWVRKNNLVMWIPGTHDFVTIPLAQEFRVFYGMGEMVSSFAMKHPHENAGLEIVESLADLIPINPTGNGGNLLVDFAPTGIQPLMQINENVDFTGKPIWRENQGNKYDPAYSKAYVSTPKYMVKISEAINEATGGDEDKRGALEKTKAGQYLNNPAIWNHLLQGYFGGMYNTISKAFDTGASVVQGEMPEVYRVPVLNRFLNRPSERESSSTLGEDYWNLISEREELMHDLRAKQSRAAEGDKEAEAYVNDLVNSDEYKRAEVIGHYQKIIEDQRKGEKAATESADKADIRETISMYRDQMMEEIAAIDGGLEPMEAAREAFDKATTFAEKNRLRQRMEDIMRRGKPKNKPKKRDEAVDKALSYRSDSDKESRDVNEQYLMVATSSDVEQDARLKALKKQVNEHTSEYQELVKQGRMVEAARYRLDNNKWFKADNLIKNAEKAIKDNQKLLGKGRDANIMKLIRDKRAWILDQTKDVQSQ